MSLKELRDKLNLRVSFHKIHADEVPYVSMVIKSLQMSYIVVTHETPKNQIRFIPDYEILIIDDTVYPTFAQKIDWGFAANYAKIIVLTCSDSPSYYANLFYLTGDILPGVRTFMARLGVSVKDRQRAVNDLLWPQYGIKTSNIKLDCKLPLDYINMSPEDLSGHDVESSLVNPLCVMLYNLLPQNRYVVCALSDDTLYKIKSNLCAYTEEFNKSTIMYNDNNAAWSISAGHSQLVLLNVNDKRKQLNCVDSFNALCFDMPQEHINHVSYILHDFGCKRITVIRCE